MNNDNTFDIERREHPRVFFSSSDEIIGTMSIPSVEDSRFPAKIMDLSFGGLCFTIKRDTDHQISCGDTLLLEELQAPFNLQMTTEISMTVRRVQDLQIVEFIGYGCEFITPPRKTAEQLKRLIDWVLREKNKLKNP